ncbi:MAG: DUF721 domain-containing protein [Bryobacteraceae bacterium]
MERAAKLLGKSKLAARCVTPQELAMAAWAGAVGKRISAHTKAVAMNGKRLIVEVEDETWRRQLSALSKQIMPRIQAAAGEGVVDELFFRVGVPRRMPVREEHAVRPTDDADAISDPTLSRIYKANRKRAIG